VPDYPKLAQLWWQNIGEAVSGEVTVIRAMDNLAKEQDRVLQRIQRANVRNECGPKLNPKKDAEYWLSKPGSPKAKVNEKPKGETVDYDKLLQAWREGRVKSVFGGISRPARRRGGCIGAQECYSFAIRCRIRTTVVS
jgi:glycerol transport system substrate-binding protein